MKLKNYRIVINILSACALSLASASLTFLATLEICNKQVAYVELIKIINPDGKSPPEEIRHVVYLQTKDLDCENDTKNRINKMKEELDSINNIKNKKQWFISYKQIINNYTDINKLDTIYDAFSTYDIQLMQQTIETECYQANFNAKVNVASVIINRIKSGEYGSTVEEIIKSPNQFAYFRDEITYETVLALEYAYMIGDTTNGCVAFRSGQLPYKWYDWTLQFVDDVGHGFYL